MINRILLRLAVAGIAAAVFFMLPRVLQQKSELRRSGSEARVVGAHFSIDLPSGWAVEQSKHGWNADFGQARPARLLVMTVAGWPAQTDGQIEKVFRGILGKRVPADAIACRGGVLVAGHPGVACSGRGMIKLCGEELKDGRCVGPVQDYAYSWNHYGTTVGLQTYLLMSDAAEADVEATAQIARSTSSFEIHD